MRKSLYTYLFERNNVCYLYNSQTNFFSSISRELFETLYNEDFANLPDDISQQLLSKKILVNDNQLYEYYHQCRLNCLSSIGYHDSLNLVITPTTGCNFACPYCFEGEKEDRKMDKDVITDLIKFVNSYKDTKELSITWYGGEPLIVFPTMKEIVGRIQEECSINLSSQSIITNGYLINDNVIEFMRINKFSQIQITFDGVKHHHNETRCLKTNRKPTYDRILTNVDKLISTMPESCRISLRININRANESDFQIMWDFFNKKYGDKRNVSVYPGFIREEGKGNNRMCCSSLFGKSRYHFYQKLSKKGVNVDFYPQLNSKGCMTCRNNSFVIGPEGELYKCWNDFNHPDRVVGNIKERAMTNPQLISRYAYDATIYSDSNCKECKFFPICDGGCSWLRYKNLFEGKDYDLCTFLADDTRLEECLLKERPSSEVKSLKVY